MRAASTPASHHHRAARCLSDAEVMFAQVGFAVKKKVTYKTQT